MVSNTSNFFSVLNPEDYLKIDLSKSTHGEMEIEEIKFIDPKALQSFAQILNDRTSVRKN